MMIPANFPKRLLILLLSFALACPIPISAQKDAAKNKEKDKKAAEKARRDADKWVAQTMKKMSLEEKLGQMLLVFYFGGFTSAGSPEYAELLEEIEKHHVGGFVVRTRGNAISYDRSQVYPTAVLANQMQRRSQLPLFVAADFERGTAMRLDEGTSFPYPMAVAAAGNPADAYTMGKITALEARACGVNWIFGPVADVNNNPDNPIINTRSYGEDPKRVGEFVAAFTRGVEENGAIATAKHFPGHGDVSTDSHVDLPTVKGDRARLESVELPPFRAAIEAGASTIMTGHLAVPAFEPNPDVPATLSSNILTGLLRKEMKFEGIVVTDAMDMGGVTVRYPPAEAAIRSIVAGADVLLVPPIVESALSGLKDAVASGRITVPRIDESVRRILQAKARLGLNVNRFVDVDALNSAFRRPEFVAAAQDITDRGI
ncbi:MAG: hypothetical protein HY046_08815, partial [Acidobacteria bacterium]|nr:hypothetical protein [Acidobacteriota bacterium]